ncbi:MAG TPA: crosslink repair DNA glycosylase YcaQ family protein [Nakamurella sp.]
MTAIAAVLSTEQVRAHRILASGLDRCVGAAEQLPVWSLGLQDRDGSARLALAARLPEPALIPTPPDPAASSWLAQAWSLRGAPHLHRRADLPALARALWPVDEADAAARLLGDTARLAAAGAKPLDAFRAAVTAMRTMIVEPMIKGEASAAVTRALPRKYSGHCQSCRSTHVRELLFRLAALPAGIGLVPGTKPVVLAPLVGAAIATEPAAGIDALVAECYRRHGVATTGEVAAHLGTSAGCLRPALPGDVVPVLVGGARSAAREGMLDELAGADVDAAARPVRLLPGSDPLLQPRDRAVLTTDKDHQKALWPVIGQPGAVLAAGGIAGIWRTRQSGGKLTITVTAWHRFTTRERSALADEAQLVGAVRGAGSIVLSVE